MFISGCTILANGNLLIADYAVHRMREFNEDGHFICDIPVSGRTILYITRELRMFFFYIKLVYS